jgi:hypothetical protein
MLQPDGIRAALILVVTLRSQTGEHLQFALGRLAPDAKWIWSDLSNRDWGD